MRLPTILCNVHSFYVFLSTMAFHLGFRTVDRNRRPSCNKGWLASARQYCGRGRSSISSFVLSRFLSLPSTAFLSPYPLVRSVFSVSSQVVYLFTGYNNIYGPDTFLIIPLKILVLLVLFVKLDFFYGYHSACENLIYNLSCT